ncbi:hypothetical protein RBB50_006834 [Rhinocladiella similis]
MLEEVAPRWHPLHTIGKGHLQNILLSNLGDEGRNGAFDRRQNSVPGWTTVILRNTVNNLPPSVKIRRDQTNGEWVEKYILREAARPFITEEVYKKRKAPNSGFSNTNGVADLVDEAFETKQMSTFGLVICLAQWVVLQRRFGVQKARSEEEILDLEAGNVIKDGTNIMLG